MTRTYTAEETTDALAVYVEHGLATAHRETGIPKSTLQKWARREGLDLGAIAGAHAERTLNASAARAQSCEALRLELREQLLVVAGGLLDRIDMVHIEFRGKDAAQVEYPNAPASACRDYVWSTAVLIDKYRLEVGEVTGRTEQLGADEVESRAIQALNELDERRAARVAS